MTKIICISGTQFALPEGMSTKDVQALAGFLITLTPVNAEYNWETSDYMHYLSARGVEVRVDEADLMTKDEAKAEASYQAYKAKRAAEEAKAD